MRVLKFACLAIALAGVAIAQSPERAAKIADKDRAIREKLKGRAATRPSFLPTSQTTTGYVADLVVPFAEEAEPAAGRRVKRWLPGYEGTEVFYTLYLPTDWRPGASYPVIVEYQGNGGAVAVDGLYDSALGYGLSGGRGVIWVCVPYVAENRREQQLTWWGDVPATLDVCRRAVREVCDRWGGDDARVILAGFSRGAIACGYLGLHDDATADLWLAFVAHSHYEGKWPGSDGPGDREAMLARLARLRGRATLVSNEGPDIFPYVLATIGNSDAPFTLLPLPRVRHTNTWALEDCPERATARRWLVDVLERRPGTHGIRGRVVDASGAPVAGARVAIGTARVTLTDAEGRYRLRSLTDGTRTVRATRDGATIGEVSVTIGGRDGDAPDIREGTR